ncbi:metallophosphoesterase [Candidatus Woesearchaeota archaeon]|nr:metallophosphoesterase [Candidatus Woesearchaeota archaeon]
MTFKLIYTADLHGNEELYKRLLKKAEDEECNAVVIGGDLCGREGNTIREKIDNQKIFLENFLIQIFKQFKQKNKNKEIYLIMGNDDFRINLKILENSDKVGIFKSIHKKSIKLNKNFGIAGYSFVNPTPFRLKDWEKPDFRGDKMPAQLFLEEIRSIEMEEGTIEEDLKNIKRMSNPKKTVYIMHAPPYNTKLDIIMTGTHVGSKSIRQFIENEQPLLALHGHIHESPKMSGSWQDKISSTICINVGSSYPEDKLNCVIIDIENLNNIKYFEL